MASSSTSSSEHGGFPWAGFASVLLVLVVDATFFGSLIDWFRLEEVIESPAYVEMGVARTHGRLAELRDIEPPESERPRVFLLGSSRAARGIHERSFPAILRDNITFVDLSCPGMRPYEMRSLIDDIRPHDPDLVIMLLSEFDTHGRLLNLAILAPGSAGTVGELIDSAGSDFMLDRREALLRLGLASQFEAYRFRKVVGAAGLTKLRVFETPAKKRSETMRATGALLSGVSAVKYNRQEMLARTKALFPEVSERTLLTQAVQINTVCRGDHQVAQEHLIRRACEELREMGSDVLILEGPLHPLAEELCDLRTREDFRDFVGELERDFGAHSMMLEDSAAFTPDQFSDPTHLGGSGIKPYTASVAKALSAALIDRENAKKDP